MLEIVVLQEVPAERIYIRIGGPLRPIEDDQCEV